MVEDRVLMPEAEEQPPKSVSASRALLLLLVAARDCGKIKRNPINNLVILNSEY